MTQLVLPTCGPSASGYVVNISSIGGKIWEPLGSWYHATKFAVEGLSDSLRVELKPHGMHVVVIEPGSIATEWRDISADHALGASGEGAYATQAAALARVYSRPADPSPTAWPRPSSRPSARRTRGRATPSARAPSRSRTPAGSAGPGVRRHHRPVVPAYARASRPASRLSEGRRSTAS